MKLLSKKNFVTLLIVGLITLLAFGSTASADAVSDAYGIEEVGYTVLFFAIVLIISALVFLFYPQKKEKKALPYVIGALVIGVVMTIIFGLIDITTYGSLGIAWWSALGFTYWGWLLLLVGTILIFLFGTIANYTLVKDKDEKTATIAMFVGVILLWVIMIVCATYITYAPLFS